VTSSEYRDPFEIPAPINDQFGRLYTHAVLEPGWTCRLCPNLLTATQSGGLLCLNCDTNLESQ
jgi:hypothetical protein